MANSIKDPVSNQHSNTQPKLDDKTDEWFAKHGGRVGTQQLAELLDHDADFIARCLDDLELKDGEVGLTDMRAVLEEMTTWHPAPESERFWAIAEAVFGGPDQRGSAS